jgi:cation diffusion facilitator family transporter
MSASGSRKVIILSLLANAGIAVSKLAGALFTGSAALMAEAVHSASDCGNQLLLLYGRKVAAIGPTERHPMGRAREGFFWSFAVALLLFSLGGLFSLYEGIHKILDPHPLEYPMVGVIILLIGIGLEAFSFHACYQEVKAHNKFGSLWRWVRRTTHADILVLFLEDTAALVGLSLALAALLAAWITGDTKWDGAGSIAIGLLLIGVAVVLAREVKSLLIGEASAQEYQEPLEALLQAHLPGARIIRLITIQQGLEQVVLAYKLQPADMGMNVGEAIDRLNAFERAVKEKFPEIKWQFAEFDREK